MVRNLILLLLLSITLSAKAQVNVSGQVIDYKAKGIAFVSIKITDSTNKIFPAKSDSLGYYFLKGLRPGKCNLTVSALGYKNSETLIRLTADTSLTTILETASNHLAEVQVSARKPLMEHRVDRIIFNAENSISGIGNDAIELLSKVPGVRVLNDRVSLVGKGAVNVMVNDKLIALTDDDLANYLKSIPAANISKIEVITNPPAKYDAQGNNGLINIVLKKNTAEGFKASLNSTFAQANFPTVSLGGNLSFRKDKITLFANFNVRKGSLVPFEQSNTFYPNQTWNIVNKDRNYRTVPGGQLGIDYQLSEKTLVGLSYSGGLTSLHSEENIKTTVYAIGGSLDSILNSDANARIKSHYHAVNFYLKQSLGAMGKQITFTGDWFKYDDDKNRFFNNTSYLQNGQQLAGSFAEYLSSGKQGIDLYTIKADVDLPYKPFTLSFGTKLTFIGNESDLFFYQKLDGVYLANPRQTNKFNYKEQTQALYANLNKRFKHFEFQAGLRAEFSEIRGVAVNETNDSHYFQLFPTLFATYHANENSEFSLNYGRRINRPAYKKLNPFRWYSNQYVYAEGNPFLKPSYNNNVSFSHLYKQVFTTTFSFSKLSDGYKDVNFIEGSSAIQVSKPVNFITGYNFQFSNSFVFNRLKWFESINQVDVYYNVAKSSLQQTLTNLSGFSAYLSTVNQFILNRKKTILSDVSFWYQFPSVEGLNNNQHQYNLDVGLKTLLLNKKLQLAINATDVLKTNRYRFSSLVNHIRQEYDNYYDSRQLRLSIRFNFGNEKIKQAERKAGNEEERRRTN
ncbi:outer membrane beta-barrel protein [Pedobacter aquatilis]|uniref:outer membrane beta-barrel protein n=1 Tax=Pedobacter aquatilis TaxID=351343 RepID=UPI002930A5F7|nr:outer membrane beta-barrel protein [Pedobacter aquatilis]